MQSCGAKWKVKEKVKARRQTEGTDLRICRVNIDVLGSRYFETRREELHRQPEKTFKKATSLVSSEATPVDRLSVKGALCGGGVNIPALQIQKDLRFVRVFSNRS